MKQRKVNCQLHPSKILSVQIVNRKRIQIKKGRTVLIDSGLENSSNQPQIRTERDNTHHIILQISLQDIEHLSQVINYKTIQHETRFNTKDICHKLSRCSDTLLLQKRQACLKRVEATVRLATLEESRWQATRQGQVAGLRTWSQSLHRLEVFPRFITVANLLIINTNSVFFPRFARVSRVFSRLTKVPRVFPPSALAAHF